MSACTLPDQSCQLLQYPGVPQHPYDALSDDAKEDALDNEPLPQPASDVQEAAVSNHHILSISAPAVVAPMRAAEPDRGAWVDGLVGQTPGLREVLERVRRVAPTDTPVLITGETGTGKELLARAIHRHSRRAMRHLVSVNLAAVPDALAAAELFGHERGAFTGADRLRVGRFEAADRGTVFLDEMGELSADLQVMLLRVLQEGEFERLGSGATRRVDVRLIAATNRDLEQDDAGRPVP